MVYLLVVTSCFGVMEEGLEGRLKGHVMLMEMVRENEDSEGKPTQVTEYYT